ncbi:hypothetical protein BESB_054590 [Besnoitia besnoiti]|uniref:tRNA(Phe) 7-[(3-amino-3-carboxypropyl)-4-demethylwyosine(37)-N(4)]-methyltransferase n=1 Tax=Besnoitia besnoiti TaxID=94643 RepID=A0A2A9MBE2_BESBE|nr:hypothetical protein BESB_054590 [Besnoitia besnoiti]PFH35808.1 hypothetical protein BESB_054590 [Besnoitia besnoiti]
MASFAVRKKQILSGLDLDAGVSGNEAAAGSLVKEQKRSDTGNPSSCGSDASALVFRNKRGEVETPPAFYKPDKSLKGSVDHDLVGICYLINEHPRYVTTSSCSGRISIFQHGPKGPSGNSKKGGKLIYASHSPIEKSQATVIVERLHRGERHYSTKGKTGRSSGEHGTRDGGYPSDGLPHAPPASHAAPSEEVWKADSHSGQATVDLKVEPFVMHIECADLEGARQLLAAATTCGLKHSGMSAAGPKRYIVAVRGSQRLETPVAVCRADTSSDAAETEQVSGGQTNACELLVPLDYLQFLIGVCNDKLALNLMQIRKFEAKLEEAFRRNVTGVDRSVGCTADSSANVQHRRTSKKKGYGRKSDGAARQHDKGCHAKQSSLLPSDSTRPASNGVVAAERPLTVRTSDTSPVLTHYELGHENLDDRRRLDLWGCACGLEYPFLCVFGGFARSKRSDSLLVYNLETSQWHSRKPSPALQGPGARVGPSLLPLGQGLMLLLFGRRGPEDPCSDVWLLDTHSWAWLPVRSSSHVQDSGKPPSFFSPEAESGHAEAAAHFGVFQGQMERLSHTPSGHESESVKPGNRSEGCQPRGRWRHAACVRHVTWTRSERGARGEAEIWIMGGVSGAKPIGDSVLDDLWKLTLHVDVVNGSQRRVEPQSLWTLVPGRGDCPPPIHSFSMVASSTDLFLLGGIRGHASDEGPLALETLYVFNIDSGVWRRRRTATTPCTPGTDDKCEPLLTTLQWKFVGTLPKSDQSWRCRLGAAFSPRGAELFLIGGGGICFTFGSHADPPVALKMPPCLWQSADDPAVSTILEGPVPVSRKSRSTSSGRSFQPAFAPARLHGILLVVRSGCVELTKQKKAATAEAGENLTGSLVSATNSQAPEERAEPSKTGGHDKAGGPNATLRATSDCWLAVSNARDVKRIKTVLEQLGIYDKERTITSATHTVLLGNANSDHLGHKVGPGSHADGELRLIPVCREFDVDAVLSRGLRSFAPEASSKKEAHLGPRLVKYTVEGKKKQPTFALDLAIVDSIIAAAQKVSPAPEFLHKCSEMRESLLSRAGKTRQSPAEKGRTATDARALPRKYERLGGVVLLPAGSLEAVRAFLAEAGSENSEKIERILWELLAGKLKADTVGLQAPILGPKRQSQVQIVYGGSGLVNHQENGVIYHFDVTRCMFASGNGTERGRFVNLIRASESAEPEIVVDLFCGIGYFSLSALASAGADKLKHVYACDWNRVALQFFQAALELNHVDPGRVTFTLCDSFQTPLRSYSHANCPTEDRNPNGLGSPPASLLGKADRISLGLIPSSEQAWGTALALLNKTRGGVLHVHGVGPLEFVERPADAVRVACQNGQWSITGPHLNAGPGEVVKSSRLKSSAAKYSVVKGQKLYLGRDIGADLTFAQQVLRSLAEIAVADFPRQLGHDRDCAWVLRISHVERVKSYAPKQYHFVVDVSCRPDPA